MRPPAIRGADQRLQDDMRGAISEVRNAQASLDMAVVMVFFLRSTVDPTRYPSKRTGVAPDLEEVHECLMRAVRDAQRAGALLDTAAEEHPLAAGADGRSG